MGVGGGGHNAPELTDHLLEPPLAVLTLVPDPSALTDARPVDAPPRQAVLVARLGRRGVSGQHQVEEHTHQQVCAHAAQPTGGGRFGSQGKRSVVTSDRGIHSFSFFPFCFLSPGAEFRTGPFGVCGQRDASAAQDDATGTTKSCVSADSRTSWRLKRS